MNPENSAKENPSPASTDPQLVDPPPVKTNPPLQTQNPSPPSENQNRPNRNPPISTSENSSRQQNKNNAPPRSRRVRGRIRGNNRNRNNQSNRRRHNGENQRGDPRDAREHPHPPPTGPPVEISGILEITARGFGFLRSKDNDFIQTESDVFVPPEIIRCHGLRMGSLIVGISRGDSRGSQLTEVQTVNGLPPEESLTFPHFDELKAINPTKRIAFETTPDRYTTRVIDIIAPVGRGQRGLIVSPPRSGKTTLLLHMAEAIQSLHEETIHLIILLVDERPEEVTEFRRNFPDAEIFASSNDAPAKNHCRLAEMCIERSKRLVEAGKDVFILMDSITRLARAYNRDRQGGKGRGYQSGGIVAGALEMPRRLFAAARNTREAGSLTIVATALIQTNSKADEAIFQEFKGTGNMELVLDRKIAENYIYPAVEIFKSGTRREELILPEHTLQKIHLIRRGLTGHRPAEAMERLLFFLKKFPNNAQMLLEIKG